MNNFAHLPILGIDPGKNCGYGLWIPETKKVYHGSWHLGDSGVLGEYYNRMLEQIEDLLVEHELEKDLALKICSSIRL